MKACSKNGGHLKGKVKVTQYHIGLTVLQNNFLSVVNVHGLCDTSIVCPLTERANLLYITFLDNADCLDTSDYHVLHKGASRFA